VVTDDDEQMKALFTTVGEQPGPPLGFTADGIARRGRRIRLARWGAGVGASLVVAGAITTTIALTANRSVEPGTQLPGPEITTTDVPTTPENPVTTTTTTSMTTTTTTPPDTSEYTTTVDTPTTT
jgi:cytoskeletal protein RodZ